MDVFAVAENLSIGIAEKYMVTGDAYVCRGLTNKCIIGRDFIGAMPKSVYDLDRKVLAFVEAPLETIPVAALTSLRSKEPI